MVSNTHVFLLLTQRCRQCCKSNTDDSREKVSYFGTFSLYSCSFSHLRVKNSRIFSRPVKNSWRLRHSESARGVAQHNRWQRNYAVQRVQPPTIVGAVLMVHRLHTWCVRHANFDWVPRGSKRRSAKLRLGSEEVRSQNGTVSGLQACSGARSRS